MVLTMTIGLTSISPLGPTSDKSALALESKINDIIKKACSSFENSNGDKAVLSKLLKSCLPYGEIKNPTLVSLLQEYLGDYFCEYSQACINLNIKGFIKRSSCGYQAGCPEVDHHKVTVQSWYIYNGNKQYDQPTSFVPSNQGNTIKIGVYTGGGFQGWGYRITAECVTIIQSGSGAPINCSPESNNGFRFQSAHILGGSGTCDNAGGGPGPYDVVLCESLPVTETISPNVNINFYWECTRSFPSFC